jgi:hypothetical protein
MTGSANDGGKDGTGRVVTGEPGFAQTGAIVHDKSRNFFVEHDCWSELA